MDNSAAIYGLRQQVNQKQRRIEELRREISRLREEDDALHNARIKTEQYHSDFAAKPDMLFHSSVSVLSAARGLYVDADQAQAGRFGKMG